MEQNLCKIAIDTKNLELLKVCLDAMNILNNSYVQSCQYSEYKMSEEEYHAMGAFGAACSILRLSGFQSDIHLLGEVNQYYYPKVLSLIDEINNYIIELQNEKSQINIIYSNKLKK